MSSKFEMKPEPSVLQPDSMPQDRSEGPAIRLTPIMPVDLGEQIVGSEHRFPVGQPVNLSRQPAMMQVLVAGDPAMSVRRFEPQVLIPREPSARIELVYAPTAVGESRSRLVIRAKWDDGHEERQGIAVTARARTLEDAPGTTGGDAVPGQASGNALQATTNVTSADAEIAALNDGSLRTSAALGRVFELQGIGVDTIEKEQAKFTAAKEEPSIWWDLAELALAMGTAGVGKIVESAVTAKVEHLLESRDAAAEEFHRAAGVVKTAHKAVSEGKRLTPEVVGTVAADGLKDAFEHGKELGAKLKPEDKSESGEQAPAESRGDSVEFFAHQRVALANAKRAATDGLVSLRASLRPLASANPAGVVAAMNAITLGYDEIAENALEVQARATAAEFAAFRTRASLGEETVRTPSGPRTATDLGDTRDPFHDSRGFHSALTPDGLLDIVVDIQGDSVRVTGARVTGIARKVAERLVRVDLLAAGVPLRIKTQGLYGDITRDELGRVRCSQLGRSFDGESERSELEPQRLRGAERVVRVVLGKRLVDWGVTQLETNDASETEPRNEGRQK